MVRRSEAKAALSAAETRFVAERVKRKRLATAELRLNIHNMRPGLAAKGLKYI